MDGYTLFSSALSIHSAFFLLISHFTYSISKMPLVRSDYFPFPTYRRYFQYMITITVSAIHPSADYMYFQIYLSTFEPRKIRASSDW